MSNATTTPFLRFPSRRSAKRVAQDARKQGISLNEMAQRNGLDLPWSVGINYLRDKDALALSGNVKDHFTASPLVPEQGRVNFVLGTPGSYVNQTALQVLMLCAVVHSKKHIGYCDYSIENRNETPGPLHYGRSSAFVDGPIKNKYMAELERLRGPWEKSFEFVRDKAVKFVSAKLPHQFRFKKAQAAIVAMNPRKNVLGGLGNHLQDKALLIADNQANSIMRLGDGKHWGQLPDQRCSRDRRNLLANTGIISEQRGLMLGNQVYLLRRSIELSDHERSSFADESVSMREVLESLEGRLKPWVEVVDELDAAFTWESRLGDSARDYASRLDGVGRYTGVSHTIGL